jgi:WD40 repeat protein/DNA-binding XRE family transcriptional regulator
MTERSFWNSVRQRRRELDLTQEELARRVGCAAITIRKIEAEDARPSQQIAERLAMALAIPLDQRSEFVRQARAARVEPVDLPTPPPKPEEIGLEDLSGRAVHGYALSEKIGSGGMGAVYRAVQPIVEREVAIKIILPTYANHPDFIRRFEAEAQLVGRLEHPFIVPMYDYWREPGVAYLVMRLLRGGNLQKLLQGGALPLTLVAKMLAQISSALGAAHRIGVIHRDLKPANILLDEDQNAYLADFGIAKNLGNPENNDLTVVDAVIGSPQYISPEQIRSLSVRPQADIYCLGVLLYEMLTGKAPYPGPTPLDYIQQHMSSPMPTLAANASGLPAGLDTVIARATAKEPDERYSDTAQMVADFHRAISGLDVGAVLVSEDDVTPVEIANPYKGLRAFGEADTDDFFGRETLVQQLLTRLGEGGELKRFLAVIGPSGSGKSSVVKAGLLPALRRGGLLGSENWFYIDMMPGAHPFEELEAALLRVAVNPPVSLLTQLKDGPRGLLRAVNRILPADPSIELFLVIDQFEELFTLTENEEDRLLFLNSLAAACMDERSRLRVVLTLRADFIDQPLRHVDFGELIQRRNELVLPLTEDELERAILGPAKRVGLRYENGLTATIIHELGEQPGSLPLLEYTLTLLFERREGQLLSKSAYQALGGVSGALGQRAEEIFSHLDPSARETARQMFLRLVTLGEGSEDTRRRVLRAELEGLAQPRLLNPLIETFGKARLLSFDHDSITRSPTVEVTHEALLREWPRLKNWMVDSRADVRTQRLLATETNEWLQNQRNASYLLSGLRLAQFAGWAENSPVALTADERAFLDASVLAERERLDQETERQQRELLAAQKLAETEKRRANEQAQHAGMLRRSAWLLSGALVVALVLAGLAVWMRQNALRQSSILLANQAEAELKNGYHDRALLLSMTALQDYPYTSQAEHALAQAVSYNRALQQYTAHQSAVTSAAWPPDGKQVATSSSSENRVDVWDPATGKVILQIDLPKGITGNKFDQGLNVQFTPDGKQLLVLTGDRYTLGSQGYDLLTYDAAGGTLLSSIEIPNKAEPESGTLGVSFVNYPTGAALTIAPKSKRLATLGGDNTALIWDAAWQTPALVLKGHTKGVSSVDWSPDETRLVTSSQDGTAIVWNAQTGQALQTLQNGEGRLHVAHWSPDGRLIACGGSDGVIRLWKAADGTLARSLLTDGDEVFSLVWAPTSARLIGGYKDGGLRIWETGSGKLTETLRGHTGGVVALGWSPEGDRLVSGDSSGNARIWNAALSTAWRVYPPQEARGDSAWSAQGVNWSSDSRSLIAAGGDPTAGTEPGSIAIWDTQTNQLRNESMGEALNFVGLDARFSPDNQSFLHLGFTQFPDFSGLATMHIFDVKTGKIIRSFAPGGETLIRSAAWSPDGTQIGMGTFNNQIYILDYKTGSVVNKMTISTNDKMFVNFLAWSPDGKMLAGASDESMVKVWDAHTWKLLYTLPYDPPAFTGSAVFSPDSKRLLTTGGNDEQGAKDNRARIWDMATGKELLAFHGHTKSSWQGTWSPDGKRAVTFGNEGKIIIWDSSTGAELQTISLPTFYAGNALWSPDGLYVAITGNETLVSIWRVWQSPAELLASAKPMVFRELTTAERQQFGLP